MKHSTLQYFMHDGPSAFRFELAGNLDDDGARRLEQDWRTASSVVGARALIVDLTFVTGVDEAGSELLRRWNAMGAQLIAGSKVARQLVEGVLGEPLRKRAVVGRAVESRTWLPFRTFFAAPARMLLVMAAFLSFPPQTQAASLKADTVAAWDAYVQSVNASLQARLRPGGSFLWTDEDPERGAKVRGSEIVVGPAPGPNPLKVSGGLIHHWIGAAFLRGAKLSGILDVTRDYGRYKEFYGPSVVESKALARGASEDRFSMLLMNKAFFLKMAVDADYRATNVRLDDRRFYSIARTTRLQEIEDYGLAGERRLPEGDGGGYLWKLLCVERLEQRDGGVYIEMEAVALSREIPGAIHLVVDPIVRRVSRSSLLASIKQTEDAVRGSALSAMKSAEPPTDVDRMSGSSAAAKSPAFAFVRVK